MVVEAASFYGPNGEGRLRICFGAQHRARLEEALDRMDWFFNELKKNGSACASPEPSTPVPWS